MFVADNPPERMTGRLPMFVADNPLRGKPIGVGGGVIGMTHGEKENHSHGEGNREEGFDGTFFVGAPYHRGESFVDGLQGHVGNREGDIQGVAGLAVGHGVLKIRGAGGDYAAALLYPFIAEAGVPEYAFGFGIAHRDETPGLSVLGRRGKTSGFQDSIEGRGVNRPAVEGSSGSAIAKDLEDVHGI